MADNGKLLIAESDYVKVKDADGNVQPDAVPKSWVGTHLLPEGWKAVGRGSGGSSSSSTPTPDPDAVPAKSENRDVLEAYAVKSAGISAEDAKAFANKDELHDAIVKAKADKAS